MKAPLILAIDPSLTRTGYCMTIASGGVEIGSILTRPDGNRAHAGLHERFDQKIRVLKRVITDRGTPDLVVVETQMVAKQTGAAETSWWHGVLRYWLFKNRYPYVEIAGTPRMKWACGDKKDRSKDAVLAAAIHAGADVHNHDEADAYWLHQIATHAYGPADAPLPRHRLEVLANIRWPEINGIRPSWVKPSGKAHGGG